MPYMHTSSISPTPILPNTSISQHVPRKTKSSLPSLFYDTTSSLPLILHLNLLPPHTTTNSKMSTILLILYLYTITTLLNPGWAQTNQYSPSHPHLNQPQNHCLTPGTHYCLHGSLQSPEMLSCVSRTKAELRSCNIVYVSCQSTSRHFWRGKH